MHIVTVLGDKRVGKTALCQFWSSGFVTSSYVSTITIDHHLLPDLTVHDTPSDARFHQKLDVYLQSTDVFILVANEDMDYDHWWARIHPMVPSATWLFVWTSDSPCPKRRQWANTKSIPIIQVDLDNMDSAEEALKRLREVASSHAPQPERIPLGYYEYFVGEARLWVPCI